MKYLITGSLGHISSPLIAKLNASGRHLVTVVTSKLDKAGEINARGAKPVVGSVEDLDFLKKAFAGMDAAYLMIPPTFSPSGSWAEYQKKVTDHYIAAIRSSGIRHVVLLSSVGAHLGKGAGPVDGLSVAEWHFSQLKDVHLKIVRPSYFYYNLMGMIPLIKNMNIMGSNFGDTDEKLVLTDTGDIADVVADDLLQLKFKGHSIRYIASDERHPREIAEVLGKAIGKPGLPWVTFKDEDALNGMLQGGLNADVAKGYVELGASLRNGTMQADYWKNRPQLGKVKLEHFAKAFAAAYSA